MKIILINPRGFCAGVDRAIDMVELALEVYGPPLYVKHAIVHNESVVASLEKKGVTFVERVSDVPRQATVVFSAHGSPPGDFSLARQRELRVIDATCPLVSKVHLEVKRYSREGYRVVLIGHKKHIEPLGIQAESPDQTVIVESKQDVAELMFDAGTKIAILTQTTLSVDDTRHLIDAIQKKYPQAIVPPAADICYATTNRQRAVQSIAGSCDLILVVGSETSSNTVRLVETAAAKGTAAFRIGSFQEIKREWLEGIETLGLTAGASTPDLLVEEIVGHLGRLGTVTVEDRTVFEENVWFDFPAELRRDAEVRGRGKQLLSKHASHPKSRMRVR